jgi:hypothetical protein
MTWRKWLILGAAVVAASVLWYLFRPELLFIDSRVAEASPDAVGAPHESVVAEGSFHSVAHQSKGAAAVHELPGGARVLRLTDFETSNGPALHVYLVAAADAQDSPTVVNAEIVDLGPLKGNKGDQNYDLPPGVDLGKYRAVTIWCQRFSVNFATAPLNARADGG